MAGNLSAMTGDVRQNLQRLDRLANLGLFSASVAHEIKHGLTAINTFVEVLLEKGEDREMAEVVHRELKRIDGLATQMLRFAAPKPPTLAPVNVDALLDHALRLLEHQMTARMISLQRDYRAAPHTVRGDESQLQQAFMNLLLNAVEAMGTNGVLTVGTEITGGKHGSRLLRIQIQDTGAGIPPENLRRLFVPFFTTKKNGTGLGLAISQRIAHEHQGVIHVQSKINKGSTFSLSLPVTE